MNNASTHLTPVHTSANRLFIQYGPNQKGRDFAVGDIHGEFSLLQRLLDKAGFNEQADRLFSVGNLVDRGPESHRVAWWLLKPWFKPVRGNHDHWCVEAGLFEEPVGHREHGGQWFYKLSEELRPFLGGFLNELPVAIEVAGRSGERYGVVHAECTCLSWTRFVEALEGELGDSYRDHHVMEALWRRKRYDDADIRPIAGIERLYVGHTVVAEVLYLAYNRAIRDEGAAKFPSNVSCKTSHQLAWPGFGRHYQHKLGNVRLTDAAALLETRHWSDVRDALAVLSAYLASADREIGLAHAFAGLDEKALATCGEAHIERTIGSAQRLWEAMIDPQHSFPCQHDAYLKLFQLSRPTLPYEVILFDEAQDSNPVTAALVAGQSARKIFVGDKWQQIYRWRGAENALDQQIEAGADVLYLTNSFRFGPMIAGVANAILALQGETRPLVGFGPRDRVTTRLPLACEQYTVLNRTVIGVIVSAIGAVSQGKAVYWNGGIEAYQLSDLEDVHYLRAEQVDRIRNQRLLAQFKTFADFTEAAEESQDPEMKRMVRLLEEHPDVPRLIATLRRHSTNDPDKADVVVSTVHRAKGLEWDIVVLEEDFPDLFDDEKISPEKKVDELNLLYVAATRAKQHLVVNGIVQAIVRLAHSKAKKAGMPQGGVMSEAPA